MVRNWLNQKGFDFPTWSFCFVLFSLVAPPRTVHGDQILSLNLCISAQIYLFKSYQETQAKLTRRLRDNTRCRPPILRIAYQGPGVKLWSHILWSRLFFWKKGIVRYAPESDRFTRLLAMSLSFHRDVKCRRWLFSEFGWGQSRQWFWQVTARYMLTLVSTRTFEESVLLTRVLVCVNAFALVHQIQNRYSIVLRWWTCQGCIKGRMILRIVIAIGIHSGKEEKRGHYCKLHHGRFETNETIVNFRR